MEKELKKIKTEVEQLSGNSSSLSTKKNNDRKKITKNTIYAILFFVVLGTLFFFQPFFIMITDKNEKKRISYIRLLVYAVIFTILLIISYELLVKWKFLKM